MVDIRILISKSRNPLFNIALEHAILTNSADKKLSPTIRLWRSEKSVVMGRNQKFADEINADYCRKNDIMILRRISGGGAVYHDLGNLNLSFFLSPEMKNKLAVSNIHEITKALTKLLLKSLKKMGYTDLEIEGNSNIFHQGRKISGSAGYMYKNWYLHHATILESVNIDHLNNSLLARESNPVDKKRSRYFETINLHNFNQESWIDNLMNIMSLNYSTNFLGGELNEDEIDLANTYLEDLYFKNSWIYQGKRNAR